MALFAMACHEMLQLLNLLCRGEGMPISKTPGTKGNLIVKFDVSFPRSLNDSQKQQLRQILPTS